ncbi:hypothetical protein K435DRAFT_807968 [Dendrothele bispora CBS 962.96]|uniref:Uncharacterized protein n=1 Tax=Dendrothele bispora (strain CBS 962.96) TaxID=1314807 RepID=A0A4S8L386_DENBC|nr:hypothetical protein K435DRAFT_807968 [Dendrothele bispora CBS 962.96]
MSDISAVVGPVIISTFTGFLILGAILSSAWNYFVHFQHDKVHFKVIVTVCVLLCIGETISSAYWGYSWGVTHYGDSTILVFLPHGLPVVLLAGASTTFIVQCVYAWRLWVISLQRNLWLPSLIVLLAVSAYGGFNFEVGAETLVVALVIWHTWFQITHRRLIDMASTWPATTIWVVSGTSREKLSTADVLISGGVFYYLDIKLRMGQTKSYSKLMFSLKSNNRYYYGKVTVCRWTSIVNARSSDQLPELSYKNTTRECAMMESDLDSLPLSVILREARLEPNPQRRQWSTDPQFDLENKA